MLKEAKYTEGSASLVIMLADEAMKHAKQVLPKEQFRNDIVHVDLKRCSGTYHNGDGYDYLRMRVPTRTGKSCELLFKLDTKNDLFYYYQNEERRAPWQTDKNVFDIPYSFIEQYMVSEDKTELENEIREFFDKVNEYVDYAALLVDEKLGKGTEEAKSFLDQERKKEQEATRYSVEYYTDKEQGTEYCGPDKRKALSVARKLAGYGVTVDVVDNISGKSVSFDESVFRGGRILEEGVRLNNKTEFNKFVDYVEKRTGIEFYGDLGEADAISDYKEATGRDLDYLIGGVDDEEGHQLAYITLGYSVGKRGDEDFNYLIEPTEGEPVYEEGLPTWKEAADKVVEFVKKLLGTGLGESRQRRGRMLKESKVEKMTYREALKKAKNAEDILFEVIGTILVDDDFVGQATGGWSKIEEDYIDEIVNTLAPELQKDFIKWVSEKTFVFDGATKARGLEEQLLEDLEKAAEKFIEIVWDKYAEKAQKMVDDELKNEYGGEWEGGEEKDLEESNRRYGNPLFEDIEVAEPQENPFKVGDILAGTWGYSMTIPMFVQVIGVTPKSVRCRQLRVLNDNGFQGHDAMARKDDFKPENGNFPNTFLARVKGEPGEEYVMCPSPRCYLMPWDGRGLYYDHMD